MNEGVELRDDITKGTWDSINVVDVRISDPNKKKVTYKCTGSIVLEMEIKDNKAGSVNISGTLTKAVREEHGADVDKRESSQLTRILSVNSVKRLR